MSILKSEALIHAEFHDAMRAASLEPPDAIIPDKVMRFPGAGKKRSNRAGWCVLFSDREGGVFGD